MIEANPNKFFPKEILYTANDQEVVRGVKKINEVKQEGYRIKELRGLPRVKIETNRGVTLTNTKISILTILENVAFDMGRQLYLISAFRSPKQNETVDGATGSQHLFGNALDVRTIELSDAEKVELVEGLIKYGAIAFGFYEKMEDRLLNSAS